MANDLGYNSFLFNTTVKGLLVLDPWRLCAIKPFTRVIVALSQKARVFATSIHFHRSLIFVGKARSFPFEIASARGFILVGSSLARKY